MLSSSGIDPKRDLCDGDWSKYRLALAEIEIKLIGISRGWPQKRFALNIGWSSQGLASTEIGHHRDWPQRRLASTEMVSEINNKRNFPQQRSATTDWSQWEGFNEIWPQQKETTFDTDRPPQRFASEMGISTVEIALNRDKLNRLASTKGGLNKGWSQ